LLAGRLGLARAARPADDELLRQVADRRRLVIPLGGTQVLMGVLFAEVVLARLAAFDVGDVKRGRLRAFLTFHGINPTPAFGRGAHPPRCLSTSPAGSSGSPRSRTAEPVP